MTDGRRNRRGAKAVWIAAIASITVHLGFLVVFLANRHAAPPAEAPAFNLEMFPRLPPRARQPRPASKTADARASSDAVRPRPPETTAQAPETLPLPPGATAAEADRAALRDALRRRLGCGRAAFFSLTSDEQKRCDEQREMALAQVGEGPPEKYDLSKGGRFRQRDETPYLARKPTKGCKLTTGGRASPLGKDGPAAGIGCVIPF